MLVKASEAIILALFVFLNDGDVRQLSRSLRRGYAAIEMIKAFVIKLLAAAVVKTCPWRRATMRSQ